MYFSFIFLFLIVVSWLVFRRKLGRRLEIITAVSVIVSSIIIAIPSIPDIQKIIGENFDDSFVAVFVFMGIIIAFLVITWISSTTSVQIAEVLIQRFRKKKLTLDYLDRSNPSLGGTLFFETKWKGMLMDGFAELQIKPEFDDVQILMKYYNEKLKEGDLSKIYDDFLINWKWNIPSTFSEGRYRIRISIKDTFSWLRILKFHYVVRMNEMYVDIQQTAQSQVSIERVMKPNIKSLNEIDLSLKPLSGWVCVKIYNESNENRINCFGSIITDIDQFPLYDYESYLKNGKTNLDGYTTFSIDPNSPKRLFADIKSSRKKITISIDVGKDEITKDFELN